MDGRKPKRAWLRPLAALAFSGGVLALLLAQLDADAVARVWRAARPGWIAVAAVISALVLATRSARFAGLIPGPRFGTITAAVGVQTLLNRVAPMRVGELSLPYLLHRYAAADAAHSTLALLLVRLLELALVLAAVVIALLLPGGGDRGSLIGVAVAVLAGVVVALLQFRQWVGLLVRAGDRVLRASRLGKIPALVRGVEALRTAAEGAGLDRAARLRLLGWSLVLLGLQFALFDAILRAFGVALPLASLFRGSCVALVAPALPVPSVGNIGTLEAGWVAGFTWVGVDLDTAILTALACQVLTLGFSATFALPSWLWLRRQARDQASAYSATQ